MQIDLISFASPGIEWRASSARFVREARATGIFSNVEVYGKKNLHEIFGEADEEALKLIVRERKGYGFWIWKPALIHHYLSNNSAGASLVMYADIGCTFGSTNQAKEHFSQIMKMVSQSGPTLFKSDREERVWTRPEVLRLYQENGLSAGERSGQFVGTLHFWRKDKDSTEFAKAWKDLCLRDPENLLVDSTSPAETEHFVAHRHDQSLLSFLAKKERISYLPESLIPQVNSGSFMIGADSSTRQICRDNFVVVSRSKTIFSLGKKQTWNFPFALLVNIFLWLAVRLSRFSRAFLTRRKKT